MADAVVARWHGDNYQARVFWENAFNLLSPHSCVVEVTFEADGPKAFDDVVVKYDPPVARSGPDRVSAEYHQIKWHVQTGGRFGYEDFTEPDFIGARSFSLLERLQEARRTAPASAQFTFLTTYRIKDGDPLAALISGHDRTLLVERLFDGTTDRSRTGKVRKRWREHLELDEDEQLRAVVHGLRVVDGHRSLQELRDQINLKAQAVGVLPCNAADSDFRYDELAQDLGREPVAVLAVLAPLAGLQLARHVHQAALLRVLLHHLHQAVLEGDDAVPFGAVHLVPRVFVEVAFIGRDRDVGDAAAVGEVADGGVGAEASDQLGVIQSEHDQSPMIRVMTSG